MSKVILKTDSSWKANMVNILPLIGKVKFSEEATIEVENEEIANKLISIMPEFSFLSDSNKELSEITPQIESDDLGKSTDDNDKIEIQVEETKPLDFKQILKSKNLDELKKLAEESIEDKELIKDLKSKKDYVEFLSTFLEKQ